MRWLDGQQPGSVARGLELSGEHFVWVVRFLDDEGHRALPQGSHWWWRGGRHSGASCHTGVFLTHCGWSSVLESLAAGVPIVALPLHIDQPINANLAAELGAAEDVVRAVGEAPIVHIL